MPENKKQTIFLENRNSLKICGVESVIALTETDASLVLGGEVLCIKGSSLKAEKLSVESGELEIVGTINMLKFEHKQEKKPFLKRLFK